MGRTSLALILECAIDRELLLSKRITATNEARTTQFGAAQSILLTAPSGAVATAYEFGGIEKGRGLSESVLPVFADIHARRIKNIVLLGFCGSLDPQNTVGHFVIPSDFIDLTRGRPRSLLAKLAPGAIFFYRMAEPFAPSLSKELLLAAQDISPAACIDSYVVTDGPRFETSAEIRMMRNAGAAAVCFSGVPDANVARELDINYAVGLFVSNMAEGMENAALDQVLDFSRRTQSLITSIACTLLSSGRIDDALDKGYHSRYWIRRPDADIRELVETSLAR